MAARVKRARVALIRMDALADLSKLLIAAETVRPLPQTAAVSLDNRYSITDDGFENVPSPPPLLATTCPPLLAAPPHCDDCV